MADTNSKVVVEAERLRELRDRAKDVGPSVSERAPHVVATDPLQAETLSRNQFLKQLRVEKRRADRTKSPLSLVLVRLEAERDSGFSALNDLLDLLNRAKRETDVLGWIAKERVGVLLPHTNERGAQAFIESISRRIAHLSTSIASATYPTELFENLMRAPDQFSDTLTLLLEEPPRRSAVSTFVKRALDVTGALAGLVILSPVMLATAIAVAATSPGPIVFRQTRLGKGGVPFAFYKFRSMRVNADDRIHREYVANLIEGKLDEVNQGDKARPLYKLTADPRITPVGRFIRKTSLDELPQLVNVLKGDMSLVGPRPPLPYEAEKYQSWHLRRVLEIRPGITGLWQVAGRSTTSFDDMVRLDLRYIRYCSLWLDLKILLQTVRVLFGSRGAT